MLVRKIRLSGIRSYAPQLKYSSGGTDDTERVGTASSVIVCTGTDMTSCSATDAVHY